MANNEDDKILTNIDSKTFKGRITQQAFFAITFTLIVLIFMLSTVINTGRRDPHTWRFICVMAFLVTFLLPFLILNARSYWKLNEENLVTKLAFRRKLIIPYKDIKAIVHSPRFFRIEGRTTVVDLSALCFKGKGRIERGARKNLPKSIGRENLRSIPLAVWAFDDDLFKELKTKLKDHDVYIDNASKQIASDSISKKNFMLPIRAISSMVIKKIGWLILLFTLYVTIYSAIHADF